MAVQGPGPAPCTLITYLLTLLASFPETPSCERRPLNQGPGWVDLALHCNGSGGGTGQRLRLDNRYMVWLIKFHENLGYAGYRGVSQAIDVAV